MYVYIARSITTCQRQKGREGRVSYTFRVVPYGIRPAASSFSRRSGPTAKCRRGRPERTADDRRESPAPVRAHSRWLNRIRPPGLGKRARAERRRPRPHKTRDTIIRCSHIVCGSGRTDAISSDRPVDLQCGRLRVRRTVGEI